MAKITIAPTPYTVFNELDEHGIFLALPRLELERNPEYKHRLMDVMVHRANSTYLGLIYGITRELGLQLSETMNIVPVRDGDGNTLLPEPAVVFRDTKCILYSNYTDGDVLEEFDRWELSGGVWSLGNLKDAINATGYFVAILLDDTDENSRSMTIFNQSSAGTVTDENLSTAGAVVKLQHNDLVPNTVAISSNNLTNRKNSISDLRQRGDYYISLENGLVYTTVAPAPGSRIRYQYIDYNFTVSASPVIIHNLQSDAFKAKMFEETEIGELGLPNTLGADVINELLTVFPTSWGP